MVTIGPMIGPQIAASTMMVGPPMN